MLTDRITFSVFTKPWRTQSIDELGRFISGLGFAGIEFPLRKGYQVEPENAEKDLPELAKRLAAYDLKITSVAGTVDENVFAACQAAGIPVIRIMVGVDLKKGYIASIENKKRELEKIVPFCEKYGIKVGIQHHYGPGVSNSMELRNLVEQFNPKYIGAIWDTAHSALAGEEPEQGLDILWSHLCMVNFKNVFYKLNSGPDAENAEWTRYFTSARNGLASWPRTVEYLKSRNYGGVICLTAEFSDEERVNRLIAEDISYAKSLFQD